MGGGNRHIENDAIKKILQVLILHESDNRFIASDSGTSGSYKKRLGQMKWFCQKCSMPHHPGMSEIKYLAPEQF